MINVNEFYQGLDALFAKNDIEGAEKYLNDGLAKAVKEMDAAASLVIVNELMGFYRAAERHELSVDMAQQGIELCKAMGLPAGPDYATTVLNAATAYRAAGQLLEAIQLYDFAEQLYDSFLPSDDYRRAALYNNMSLAMQGLKRFEEAGEMLEKALNIVKTAENADEIAATYVNISANCFLADDSEAAEKSLRSALDIYENGHETDSHYAAALTMQGQINERKEEWEKAAQSYVHAIEITFGNYGNTPTTKELYKAALRCCQTARSPLEEQIENEWKNKLT